MKKDKTTETKKETKKADSFSLKNYMLKLLNVMLSVPLHSEKASARNKVLKLIAEKLELFEEDRMEIIKKYAKKDNEGELVMEVTDKGKNYILEDEKSFSTEYEVIAQQEVIFDILPSNRGNWKLMLDVIKDTKLEMDPSDTEAWETIIEALKTI